MSNASNGQLLGVVLLTRHGDREGFYQDPKSYTPFGTAVTPLGTQEEFQLGQFLRRRYLNGTSPTFIQGINNTVVNSSQIRARADAGGEGGVIYNSALALLQGLFPPTPVPENIANGTTVTAPLGGYQYIPIESVEPDNDFSLEGWTLCNTFNKATKDFYASAEFKEKEKENAAFLSALTPYISGRSASLVDMWNIFDFLNVQSIHDEAFRNFLPATVLAQARDLANFHEYGVFTSQDLGGIGNIAGQTILPSILEGFAQIANPSNPLKILYQGISYKPFISLFNMTGVAQKYPQLAGIVDYASVLALEVRSSDSGPVLRFNFKNGTRENDFTTFNMFGSDGDVPLVTFVNRLSSVAINDTVKWCSVCQNVQDRGCGDLTVAANQAISRERLHPIGAGFLGAGMTIAFMIIVFLFAYFLGFIRLGPAKKKSRTSSDSGSSIADKA